MLTQKESLRAMFICSALIGLLIAALIWDGDLPVIEPLRCMQECTQLATAEAHSSKSSFFERVLSVCLNRRCN